MNIKYGWKRGAKDCRKKDGLCQSRVRDKGGRKANRKIVHNLDRNVTQHIISIYNLTAFMKLIPQAVVYISEVTDRVVCRDLSLP